MAAILIADIEAERSAPTVAELIDRFEQEHLPRKRASTAADYRRMLNNHIRPHFGEHSKVADITFADIDRLIAASPIRVMAIALILLGCSAAAANRFEIARLRPAAR